MDRFRKWFSHTTEAIAAGMLAAIFLVFMLQIVLRYFFTPAGWTLEFIGILWVWVIFFSCAFVVREQDQVRFDIILPGCTKTGPPDHVHGVGVRDHRRHALCIPAHMGIHRLDEDPQDGDGTKPVYGQQDTVA